MVISPTKVHKSHTFFDEFVQEFYENAKPADDAMSSRSK